MEIDYDVEVDVRGLKCPLPILRTKKVLFKMKKGKVLRIISTDQDSIRDFQAFSKQTGNFLLAQEKLGNGEIVHYLLHC